jgi:hypothetical protein
MTEAERVEWETIAVLVHEGHDQFQARHCDVESCRRIAALLGTRGYGS